MMFEHSTIPVLFPPANGAPNLAKLGPIEVGPAPVYCTQCAIEVIPVPLSDPARGWIMHPCHETECSCCYSVGLVCGSCDCIEDCCTCVHCSSCNDIIDETYGACSQCDECEDCCTCRSCCHCGDKSADFCFRCSDSDWICDECCRCSAYVIPGWTERNIVRPTDAPECVHKLTADDRSAIDPVQSMADFYLLDYVRTVVSQALAKLSSDRLLSSIIRDCARLQDAIVARCDATFQDYVFAAIGGEARHHQNVDDMPTSRSSAWDYWFALGELNGRAMLTEDCVDLFDCDSWGGAYGGAAWRTIAQTLHNRLTGRLDARTFVDRVFSLQHNGGSLLNKMEWASFTRYGRNVQYCQIIGNAHDAVETDFAVLMSCASDDVITLAAAASSAVPQRDAVRFSDGISIACANGATVWTYELPAFRGVYPRPFTIREDRDERVRRAAYNLMLGYSIDASGEPVEKVRDADWTSWEENDGHAGFLALAQIALESTPDRSESVSEPDSGALMLQALMSDQEGF